MSCNRTGRRICKRCNGNGRLRWYLQLVVTFKNIMDDHFKKSDMIPDELLRKYRAKSTFSEVDKRVN